MVFALTFWLLNEQLPTAFLRACHYLVSSNPNLIVVATVFVLRHRFCYFLSHFKTFIHPVCVTSSIAYLHTLTLSFAFTFTFTFAFAFAHRLALFSVSRSFLLSYCIIASLRWTLHTLLENVLEENVGNCRPTGKE